jgi:hypothetical protein
MSGLAIRAARRRAQNQRRQGRAPNRQQTSQDVAQSTRLPVEPSQPPSITLPVRTTHPSAGPHPELRRDKVESKTTQNALKTVFEEIGQLKDECNQFQATTICSLPLYDAIPHTPQQLQNNMTENLENATTYRVSYPQVDGACGLIFMKVWLIDKETANITKKWVPFALGSSTDGLEAQDILGFPEDAYIFMKDCKFPVL